MPVLLTEEHEFDLWLRGTVDEAMTLARPFPDVGLRIVQAGFGKEDEGK